MRALLTWIRMTEAIVATAAYAAVAILLMTDVIGREILGTSILGLQQMAVYGAIVAGFLGLTLATSDNAHLRPEFLDFVAAPVERAAQRLGDTLSGLFFFACAWVAFDFVQFSREAGDKAPVLYFMIWPLQLVLPYAFGSAGLKHIVFALRPALKLRPDQARG